MLMYNLTSYADRPGHRVYDDDGPSAFSTILFAIFAIVIGGFLGFLFLGGSAADGFKDKEVTKVGCSGIICVIVGIILLVGMCSH
jgi:hypothetical protein